MSKITGSFLVLVFVIIFSSIIYIWQADREKRELESQIKTQQETITALESQVAQQPTPADTISNGVVLGNQVSEQTGVISGTVTIKDQVKADAIVICASQTDTKQETCIDNLLEPQKKSYDFSLELPAGSYIVYALLPPSETKVFYSDVPTCDESGDCSANADKKRQIQVNVDETQADINLYL